MTTSEFIASVPTWLWPCFYAGIGFATIGAVAFQVSLVYYLRTAAEKKLMNKLVSEILVKLTLLPALFAIGAGAVAITWVQDVAMQKGLYMYSLTICLFGVLSWYLYKKVGTREKGG